MPNRIEAGDEPWLWPPGGAKVELSLVTIWVCVALAVYLFTVGRRALSIRQRQPSTTSAVRMGSDVTGF